MTSRCQGLFPPHPFFFRLEPSCSIKNNRRNFDFSGHRLNIETRYPFDFVSCTVVKSKFGPFSFSLCANFIPFFSFPANKYYVIPTISYSRARTIETSSLPNDSMRPLFKQRFFSGILTVYFNCKYFT